MPTWKKVIVSGSTANLAALQVDNLTSGQVVIGGGTGNLSTTPINGTGNIVATTNATNLVHSGSFSGSFQGSLTGTATTASYVLQAVSASFATTASYAPNIYNSDGSLNGARTVTSNGNNLTFNASSSNVSFNLLSPGTFEISGSNRVQIKGLDTLAQANIVSINTSTGQLTYFATSSIQNVVSSSFASTASFVTTTQTASYVLNAVSASLAQTARTASNITPAITNNTNNYVLTANGDGTINGEANLQFTGTTLTVTGNEVITGNLTVQGTASFQQTTNLEVADRFILLASGSNTTGDGGLVVQQATQNVGELYGYDAAINRWAFTSSFTANQASFTPAAYVTTTEVGTGSPPTSPVYGGASNGYGNIFVNTVSGDIFIYS